MAIFPAEVINFYFLIGAPFSGVCVCVCEKIKGKLIKKKKNITNKITPLLVLFS